jgi:hypothetical protein
MLKMNKSAASWTYAKTRLPTDKQARGFIALREFDEGWLSFCEREGIYGLWTEEFLDALSTILSARTDGPVLEVAAGNGTLASHLRSRRIEVNSTDPANRGGLTARRAIEKHYPKIVISAFAPYDADVDTAVLEALCVQHYVAINTEIDGRFGHPRTLSDPRWRRQPADRAAALLFTRYDTPIDEEGQRIIQHGGVLLLQRVQSP